MFETNPQYLLKFPTGNILLYILGDSKWHLDYGHIFYAARWSRNYKIYNIFLKFL